MVIKNDQLSEELSPIFINVGMALKDIQFFEQSLVVLLSMIDEASNGPYDDTEFDRIYSKEGRKTLGRLIKSTRAKLQIQNDAIIVLDRALEARNFLVHRLFQESWDLFTTATGRAQVGELVSQKRSEVRNGYEIIDPIVVRILNASGVNVETLTKEAGEKFE